MKEGVVGEVFWNVVLLKSIFYRELLHTIPLSLLQHFQCSHKYIYVFTCYVLTDIYIYLQYFSLCEKFVMQDLIYNVF